MPKHIDYVALIVKDPKQAIALFESIFDDFEVAPGLYEEEMRVHMDGVRLERVTGTPPDDAYGDHLAFAVDAEGFNACARRLSGIGRYFQMARGDTALYFSDEDDHMLKLDGLPGRTEGITEATNEL